MNIFRNSLKVIRFSNVLYAALIFECIYVGPSDLFFINFKSFNFYEIALSGYDYLLSLFN